MSRTNPESVPWGEEAVERSLAGATTEVASRAGFAEDGRHG
jgi:hypothetical protein